VPEEPGRLLERGVGRELTDGEAGDEELAGLAVDVTEARGRGNNALEPSGCIWKGCHGEKLSVGA
jgi:hypothetical protein